MGKVLYSAFLLVIAVVGQCTKAGCELHAGIDCQAQAFKVGDLGTTEEKSLNPFCSLEIKDISWLTLVEILGAAETETMCS